MTIKLTEQEINEIIEMIDEATRTGNAAEVKFLLFMKTGDLEKAMEIIANS